MKTKIITVSLLLSVFALFTLSGFAEEPKEAQNQPERKMIKHKLMMRKQHQMMDMRKMGSMMDSSTTKCARMIKRMEQMDPQNMTGGQLGMKSMMGTTQCLKNMTEQMKAMSQNMDNIMKNKEVVNKKEQFAKMKEMQEMMEETTRNLDRLTDLNQKMMDAMAKQKLE